MNTNSSKETIGFRDALKEKVCCRVDFKNNQQNVHTPFDLCNEMIGKLVEVADLTDKNILTLNLEFIEVLCYDYGVSKERIWFITDCKEKANVIKHDRYKGVNVVTGNYLLTECKNMKFDVIVGNPPYNPPKNFTNGPNQSIWPDFVKKSIQLLKDNGFLCLIHPCGWRKPESELWNLMTSNQIHFLNIYSKDDGSKLFNRDAVARVDWYVLQHKKCDSRTRINDQDGKDYEFILSNLPFLPNGSIDDVMNLVVEKNDSPIGLVYDSSYHSQRDHMKSHKTKTFKYPCVHSITMDGLRIIYSNINSEGHFKIKKVIINRGDTLYPYNDYKGEYGMTENSFGLVISSKKEGDLIVKAINTPKFKEIVKATKWGNNAMVDWRYFKQLKQDFWKYFVDEHGNIL